MLGRVPDRVFGRVLDEEYGLAAVPPSTARLRRASVNQKRHQRAFRPDSIGGRDSNLSLTRFRALT